MTQEIQTERMPKAMCVSLRAGHGEEFFERALPIGNGGLKLYLTGPEGEITSWYWFDLAGYRLWHWDHNRGAGFCSHLDDFSVADVLRAKPDHVPDAKPGVSQEQDKPPDS
jgi:hypothetical protein